jgi:hypothetical protein
MKNFKSENAILYNFLLDNLNSVNNFTEKSAKYFTEMMGGSHGMPILLPFDSPDILLLFDDKTLLLEHFQFDSSQRNNRGSLLQAEKNLFIKKNTNQKFSIIQIENEGSIEYYISNLMDSTISHHNKIGKYMDNVSKKKGFTSGGIYKDIKQESKEFGFVIEDTSLDYNMFINSSGKYEYITCLHIKEFRDFLHENSDIEHVFHLVKNNQEKRVIYYFHNIPDELELLNKTMEYKSPDKIEKADVYFWNQK